MQKLQSHLMMLFSLVAGPLACSSAIHQTRGDGVDSMYARGVEDLEDGLFPEASKEFGEVKSKFPYSRFAALAELRLADTNMRRGRYQEAIDAYRNFVKFHPNHDQADYALFRIAEAHFAQIPTDWFFLPPAAEKDQASTRLAIAAYQDFLARYGEGPSARVAQTHLDACRRKLADHEMFVARFYFSRARYASAAQRANEVLQSYGGLGLDAEALWIAGKSEYERGHHSTADVFLQRLVTQYGQTPQAAAARDLQSPKAAHQS